MESCLPNLDKAMTLSQFAAAWKPKATLNIINRYAGKTLVFEEINQEPRYKEANKRLLASDHGLTISYQKGDYVRIEEKL
jgi:hypothetical protein